MLKPNTSIKTILAGTALVSMFFAGWKAHEFAIRPKVMPRITFIQGQLQLDSDTGQWVPIKP